MLFKIVLKNQIRIFDCKDTPTLNSIYQFINKTFPKLKDICLCYCDEDGDQIVLESDIDLSVYLQVCGTKPKIYIRSLKEGNSILDNSLEVNAENVKKQESINPNVEFQQKLKARQEPKEDEIKKLNNSENIKEQINQEKIQKHEEVHEAQCDKCGAYPIVGIRYKCGVCLDFDECEKCQEAIGHNHPLIKIRYVCQTPLKINFQFPKSDNKSRLVLDSSKSETIKYESEEQKSQLIISYLQNLLGDQQSGLYHKFSRVSKSLTFEELFSEYLTWLQGNESRVPRIIKWLKELLPNLKCRLKGL